MLAELLKLEAPPRESFVEYQNVLKTTPTVSTTRCMALLGAAEASGNATSASKLFPEAYRSCVREKKDRI
jgi:hypothetical protein